MPLVTKKPMHLVTLTLETGDVVCSYVPAPTIGQAIDLAAMLQRYTVQQAHARPVTPAEMREHPFYKSGHCDGYDQAHTEPRACTKP